MSEPRHPVGPEIDDSGNPTTVSPEDPNAQPAADAGWGNDATGTEPGARAGSADTGGTSYGEGASSGGESFGGSESFGDGASDTGAGNASDTGAGSRRPINGRDMLTQLQAMIDSLAVQATPVMREVAAKAAELAAVAGQKAGPLAHRAAEATEKVGERVAARSKEVAADLRRPKDAADEAAGSAGDEPRRTFENDETGG